MKSNQFSSLYLDNRPQIKVEDYWDSGENLVPMKKFVELQEKYFQLSEILKLRDQELEIIKNRSQIKL